MDIKTKIKSLPLIGWLSRWLYNLLRINNIKYILFNNKEAIEKLQQKIYEKEKTEEELKRKIYDLEDRYLLLEQELERKSDILDTKKLYEKLLSDKVHLLVNQNKLDSIIKKAKDRFSEEELKDISKLKNSKFEYLYKEFEDRFRGTREEVKKSLKVYLPFLNNISTSKDIKIVDIGCGRGEWLELLKEHGYSPLGIDKNENMIQECKKLMLDVKNEDALGYLKTLPSNSLHLITGFHIIEHINDFDDILELFQDSYRVLKKGGFIIFETPNPRNILVSSSDFYLDPSHIKPLHPLTMKFFIKQIGFKNPKSLIVEEETFKEIDDIDFSDIKDYINIGRNYAVVGEKP
jgi:O-antigen chain-terminating methyltransferase